jgi:hypothetical protein
LPQSFQIRRALQTPQAPGSPRGYTARAGQSPAASFAGVGETWIKVKRLKGASQNQIAPIVIWTTFSKIYQGLEHPDNIEKVAICITLCHHPQSRRLVVARASLAQLAKAKICA